MRASWWPKCGIKNTLPYFRNCSILDVHVTCSTENQYFAAACRHQFDPDWLFAAWVVDGSLTA